MLSDVSSLPPFEWEKAYALTKNNLQNIVHSKRKNLQNKYNRNTKLLQIWYSHSLDPKKGAVKKEKSA